MVGWGLVSPSQEAGSPKTFLIPYGGMGTWRPMLTFKEADIVSNPLGWEGDERSGVAPTRADRRLIIQSGGWCPLSGTS